MTKGTQFAARTLLKSVRRLAKERGVSDLDVLNGLSLVRDYVAEAMLGGVKDKNELLNELIRVSQAEIKRYTELKNG